MLATCARPNVLKTFVWTHPRLHGAAMARLRSQATISLDRARDATQEEVADAHEHCRMGENVVQDNPRPSRDLATGTVAVIAGQVQDET